MIAAPYQVLRMIGPDTRLIPGRGPVADRTVLRAYRDMLAGARARVMRHVARTSEPRAGDGGEADGELDSTWGKSFFTPAQFVEILYSDLYRGKRERSGGSPTGQ